MSDADAFDPDEPERPDPGEKKPVPSQRRRHVDRVRRRALGLARAGGQDVPEKAHAALRLARALRRAAAARAPSVADLQERARAADARLAALLDPMPPAVQGWPAARQRAWLEKVREQPLAMRLHEQRRAAVPADAIAAARSEQIAAQAALRERLLAEDQPES